MISHQLVATDDLQEPNSLGAGGNMDRYLPDYLRVKACGREIDKNLLRMIDHETIQQYEMMAYGGGRSSKNQDDLGEEPDNAGAPFRMFEMPERKASERVVNRSWKRSLKIIPINHEASTNEFILPRTEEANLTNTTIE